MLKIIVTEDIELKLVEMRHAEADLKLINENREYLREWLPWLDFTNTVDDINGYVKRSLQQFADGTAINLGIWYKGELTGVISLMEISGLHSSASIGYWLGEKYTGNGIITEACKTVLKYAFDELNLNRVEIRCAEENHRSRAIPARLGFTEEGKIREAEFLYDYHVTHVVYGMLRSEWK